MNTFMRKTTFLALITLIWNAQQVRAQVTTVEIDGSTTPVQIDPMIYGQMLENVNDSMIYGGIADLQGNIRHHLTPRLRDLQIPVMRWPGGTGSRSEARRAGKGGRW